jgi:ribosomal protein S9
MQPPGAQPTGVGLQMPAGAGTATPAAAGAAAPQTFAQALSKVPGAIAEKFTDPKALADMTLRAAGQLAGAALAGSGLSDQEQALLNAQTEELRTLQQTNADLFRQKLEQAQGVIGESRYFDPEYFGLQRARQAQLAGARAKRKGLRGLEGQQRAAEARRFDLATGRDVGTAYDVGFGTGVQGRLQTMQSGMAGLQGLTYPSTSAERRNIYDVYSGAAERQQQRQQQIGSLFGSLTGEQKAKKKGEEAV